MDLFSSKLVEAEGIKVSLWTTAHSHLPTSLHTDLEDLISQRQK